MCCLQHLVVRRGSSALLPPPPFPLGLPPETFCQQVHIFERSIFDLENRKVRVRPFCLDLVGHQECLVGLEVRRVVEVDWLSDGFEASGTVALEPDWVLLGVSEALHLNSKF